MHFPVLYGIKQNGEVIILRIEFRSGYMQLDPLVADVDLSVRHLYTQDALFIHRFTDNADFSVRLDHDTVTNVEFLS